jgi:uncharacterized membrane protein (UPF0136 family)
VGAGVGLVVGVVVGGTLGRIFMRILFLAQQENNGFTTAMGAIVGDLTRSGTGSIYAFAGIVGLVLGLAYTVARALLPSGTRIRVIVFTLGTTAFMVGQIVRSNRDDFSFLPVTLSLLLVVASVALTAAPVPLLVERLAPDRERHPGRLARGVVVVGMAGFALFALTGIAIAYSEPRPF